MAEIILNGPEGRLEGRYTAGTSPDAPIALVLHPHPLHGGSMNNKVVYNIYQAFAKRGFTVMRFNFRGVGRSQGSYGKGEGELADAATALDWLQQHYQNAQSCWIAGFSFGAWIALQLLMRRPEISSFITASPPPISMILIFSHPAQLLALSFKGMQTPSCQKAPWIHWLGDLTIKKILKSFTINFTMLITFFPDSLKK